MWVTGVQTCALPISKASFSNVLFPHPLGPIMAIFSPLSTIRLAFLNNIWTQYRNNKDTHHREKASKSLVQKWTLSPNPNLRLFIANTVLPLLPRSGNLIFNCFLSKGFSINPSFSSFSNFYCFKQDKISVQRKK